MNDGEKDLIKLRFGLALKRLLENKKTIGINNKLQGIRDRDLVDSYLKLERASGLPKATLIGIFQGRINAASSSLSAIIEALGVGFTSFGAVYDSITEADIRNYRELLKQNRQLELQKAKKRATLKDQSKKISRKRKPGK